MKASELTKELVDMFLCKIYSSDKKIWKPEEIEAELLKCMFHLSVEYLEEAESLTAQR